MSIHYNGISWSKSSIFVRLGFHGDAHSWGLFQQAYFALIMRFGGGIGWSTFVVLHFSAANNQDMPVSKYFKADVTILGFCIPSVGFLVVKDPSTVLEPQYSTQMPGVIRCNLIRLGCEEFGKVFGFEAFETFTCPKEVHPLIFAQMCTLYHQGKVQVQSDSHTSNNSQSNTQQSNSIHVTASQVNFHSTQEDLSPSDAIPSQVWVGSPYQNICIPANSVKVVQGKTSRDCPTTFLHDWGKVTK